jgi:tetratricopeptide (TPR) repeat protein
VERRLAVLAADDPQALSRRGARRRTWLVVLAIAAMASPAAARPKRRDARAAFDRGVAAYKRGNFEAASEALGKSFDLERDVDTLFAWAQSERKLDRCDKAIDLYERLLTFDLAPANRDAVNASLAECRAQIPVKPEPVPAEPVPSAPAAPPASTRPEGPAESTGIVVRATPGQPPPIDSRPAGRAWYKDPITLTLLGSGVVATSVGISFLVSASAAHTDFLQAKTYADAQQALDTARSRQTIGFITTGAGAVLVAGGVAWIVLHHDSPEQHAISGWLAPGGGGLAVTGAF